MRNRSSDRVIGPSPGVFQIENLVTKGPETEKVVKIVPNDPPKRVLADEAGDNDSHGDTLRDF
jgi:hypothetical protein